MIKKKSYGDQFLASTHCFKKHSVVRLSNLFLACKYYKFVNFFLQFSCVARSQYTRFSFDQNGLLIKYHNSIINSINIGVMFAVGL